MIAAVVVAEEPMNRQGRVAAVVDRRAVPGYAADSPVDARPADGVPSFRPVMPDRGTEELDLAAQVLAAPARGSEAGGVPSGPLDMRDPHGVAGRRTVAPGRPPAATGQGSGPRVPTVRADEAATPRRAGGGSGEMARLGLHLVVAALPLLAISAHVFGVLTMNRSAGLLVLPLTALAIGLCVMRPLPSDRLVLEGMLWGLLATVIYDAFRLDTVYLLGWWGDFIPNLGTWILNIDPRDRATGAVVGYTWRYLGDGGGIGMTFYVAAAATGLRRLGRTATIAASVGFAVFPVWAGLIATVGLASHGQTLMFRLTPTTITLSLIGHLIFGVVMGIGTWRSKHLDSGWPWTPLLDRGRLRPDPSLGPWTTFAAHHPGSRSDDGVERRIDDRHERRDRPGTSQDRWGIGAARGTAPTPPTARPTWPAGGVARPGPPLPDPSTGAGRARPFGPGVGTPSAPFPAPVSLGSAGVGSSGGSGR